jgi:hypothetical protein
LRSEKFAQFGVGDLLICERKRPVLAHFLSSPADQAECGPSIDREASLPAARLPTMLNNPMSARAVADTPAGKLHKATSPGRSDNGEGMPLV